jgi:hypothetical protein
MMNRGLCLEAYLLCFLVSLAKVNAVVSLILQYSYPYFSGYLVGTLLVCQFGNLPRTKSKMEPGSDSLVTLLRLLLSYTSPNNLRTGDMLNALQQNTLLSIIR